MKTYWVTLAISDKDLAEEMDCKIEEIENLDYLGAIRDFAEISSVETVEDAPFQPDHPGTDLLLSLTSNDPALD